MREDVAVGDAVAQTAQSGSIIDGSRKKNNCYSKLLLHRHYRHCYRHRFCIIVIIAIVIAIVTFMVSYLETLT